ncbi:unnamed protein product, partial [Effrenium voratum]
NPAVDIETFEQLWDQDPAEDAVRHCIMWILTWLRLRGEDDQHLLVLAIACSKGKHRSAFVVVATAIALGVPY